MDNSEINNQRGKTAIPEPGKRKYLSADGDSLLAASEIPATVADSSSENKVQLKPNALRRYLNISETDDDNGHKTKIKDTQQISSKEIKKTTKRLHQDSDKHKKLEHEEVSIKVSSRVTLDIPLAEKQATVEAEPVASSGISQRFLQNLRNSLPADAKEIDHDGILEVRSAGKEGRYELVDLFAKGAESLLYRARTGRQFFCVKAIRNHLDSWLGNSKTKRDEEKLQDVSYSTKLRHLRNEYEVARALYNEQEEIPVVRIFALRRITKFGLELGYDLLMEYLWGHDLSQRNLLKLLTPEDKIRIMYEATQALNYVHKHKFIHLDIKPSNFVLTHTGRVRLIDFGISVLHGYRSRSITGTAGYLSPEQIAKETLDEKTDIFALGVTFAILFGGKPLLQMHSELLNRSVRRDAKFHMESGNVSAIGEIPELMNMPEIAEIIRNCSILKRDNRISSCGYLSSLLQSAAKKYAIQLV